MIRAYLAHLRAKRARDRQLAQLDARLAAARASHSPTRHIEAERRRVTHEALRHG